jgi:NarL family two-component system response regulator LiaR
MADLARIRVMIVDDHAVVRSGIEYALLTQEDIVLVASLESGEQAVQQCCEFLPDVVLMDMMMPGMDGAEATAALLTQCPQARVLILTSFREGQTVQQGLEAGAIGYLLKDVGMDELGKAIRSAAAGRGTLAPDAARALAEAATQPPKLGTDLTDRELEVLVLVAAGKSNVEIAEDLSVSVSTARFHVSTILSKLGATNRAEAAALAVKHGLVD